MVAIVAGVTQADASGQDLFTSNCVVCHQANAEGVAGFYPPLAHSIGNYVRIPQGRVYLVHVLAFGLTGTIAAHGQSFFGVMQSWPKFSDGDVAQVLDYVLASFNSSELPKGFAQITAEEVKRNRAREMTSDEVHRERDALMKMLESGAVKH